jgi:tRNA-Thr(GGU) m(6)t(6)A37 methyltransferase TsaA
MRKSLPSFPRIEMVIFEPIGIIYSPFTKPEGMPVQPSAARGVRGNIVIEKKYTAGLADLEGFSHIYLIYHLHLSKKYNLKVIPFLDNRERGLFATRAPRRPNPIGLSVVHLLKIERNILDIEDVDIIDGTPLLDIKPYVPEMEDVQDLRIGWLSKYTADLKSKKADGRFS